MIDPQRQRDFATQVVEKLRAAGFVAYFAGGCVRDQLLDRVPKDYDVATNATPPEIRQVFGHRHTLAIGAAFGVITVKGPRAAGMVEVATFREDAEYSDGRHPDHVTFSTAEADASRRDFTINGLFYDPVEQKVIDFVGGQEDLRRGVLRAIGTAHDRFDEDKLRMLRAVRMAATFDFALDEATRAAIVEMADLIDVVSPERIAMEMRRMLAEPYRVRAARLLVEAGLARKVLPEVLAADGSTDERFEQGLRVIDRLAGPEFPLALVGLLHPLVDVAAVRRLALRWRLSNKEAERAAWLVENHAALSDAPRMPFSRLQPLLIKPGIDDLLALHEAIATQNAPAVAYCRQLLERPREQLDPPPLLTGNDLLTHDIAQGPRYRDLLEAVRNAQLDGKIHDRDEALALVDQIEAKRKAES